MTQSMTIFVLLGMGAVFVGLSALADVVYNRSRTYCNEPGCKRFLADDEKLLAHDQKLHGQKWPDGRPFLDFTRAYKVGDQARWKWSIRQVMWGMGVMLVGLFIINHFAF